MNSLSNPRAAQRQLVRALWTAACGRIEPKNQLRGQLEQHWKLEQTGAMQHVTDNQQRHGGGPPPAPLADNCECQAPWPTGCSLAGLQYLSHSDHAAACNAQRRQVHLAVLLEQALQGKERKAPASKQQWLAAVATAEGQQQHATTAGLPPSYSAAPWQRAHMRWAS